MSHTAQLNLVVLRSANLSRAQAFYEVLGLSFDTHRHGNGPEHLACERDGFVFELYPLADMPTSATRIGFAVDDVDRVVSELQAIGAELHQAPKDSPWGRRAVMRDFDGHLVELVAK
ncbi:VOC family protein [Aeoliella sp. SH292]|uniref:VOC family protein n=1 Tax=Aeoliella sp. SH292 TaxID=3454464 RepID=UPI003F955A90